MNQPLYSIGTYDWERGRYSPQIGVSVPSYNITRSQLLQAMRELKGMGYTCHRRRDANGNHYDNDSDVLIERTDGRPAEDIYHDWDR